MANRKENKSLFILTTFNEDGNEVALGTNGAIDKSKVTQHTVMCATLDADGNAVPIAIVDGKDLSAYATKAYVDEHTGEPGGEAKVVEYADLDAPYAGYPFRHTPGGKIVEQEHYILPLDVPLNLYVNPVPPVTDAVEFNDRTHRMTFRILTPEETGVPVNIAVLYQNLGLNENGEYVDVQYIYTPQEISLMGNSAPKGWLYMSFVDGENDFTTLRPISYDEVPRMSVEIHNEDAEEWEPAGGTYLSETPYLSEGSLYYWNGAEYVEVGKDGADGKDGAAGTIVTFVEREFYFDGVATGIIVPE